jgi:fumarate reductase subunit D
MVAALLAPILLLLFGVAFPLGWLTPPDHAALHAVVSHPITVLALFGLCVLALFHWAHRFRYTLYDGLRLKKAAPLIIAVCYGGAVAGSVIAAVVLVRALLS